MSQSHVRTTKEYRAKVFLTNNTVVTITGSNQQHTQETIQSLIMGQPNLSQAMKGRPLKFEQSQEGTLFVYHDSYLNGEQPIGWVTEFEVPEILSVKAITEHRLQQQKAA